MTDAKLSHDGIEAASSRPLPARLLAVAAIVAVLLAALGLWARFGEGVYAQMLLNAVIACF